MDVTMCNYGTVFMSNLIIFKLIWWWHQLGKLWLLCEKSNICCSIVNNVYIKKWARLKFCSSKECKPHSTEQFLYCNEGQNADDVGHFIHTVIRSHIHIHSIIFTVIFILHSVCHESAGLITLPTYNKCFCR